MRFDKAFPVRLLSLVFQAAVLLLFFSACSGDPTAPRTPMSIAAAIGVDPETGATIETNKDDYQPGEIVHLEGHGWAPGETVSLAMTEEPDTHEDVYQEVQADGDGKFSIHFYDVQQHDLGVTFTLVATGLTSGSSATAVFTDNINTITMSAASPTPFSPNQASSAGIKDLSIITLTNPPGNANNVFVRIRSGTALAGSEVRSFPAVNVSGSTTQDFNWDGKNNSAVFVADGIYTARMANTTGSGTTEHDTPDRKKTIVVDNTNPTVAVDPIANGTPGVAMTITGNTSDLPAVTGAGLEKVEVTIQRASDNAVLATGLATNTGTNFNTWSFSYTPSEGSVQKATAKATDNAGNNTTSAAVNFTTNAPPVLTPIGDQEVDEEDLLTFTATATDEDVPSLAFTLEPAEIGDFPTGATITTGGVFNWTPSEAQGPGIYRVKVVVTDNGLLADEEDIEIEVKEVNLAPVLATIGNPPAVDEGTELAFTATATDDDLPANTLTFSLAAGAPAGAAITAGGDFTWTPTEAQGPGVYPITVVVTDNGDPVLFDTETIQVTVNEANIAPVLDPIGDQEVDELTLLTFTATASDDDVPPNTLTFSLDAGFPAGAAITPGGVFTWTPTEAQGPGSFTVTVRVTDNGVPAKDAFEEITIKVNEVNLAPELAPIGDKTVNEGAALTFNATADDDDIPANQLTFSLGAGAPAGAAISPSGAFSWTPTEAQGPGSFSITVKVTDDGEPALSDEETITVTVNEVNQAPVLAGIGNQIISEGSLLSFTATATDGDLPANTLTFSLDAGAPVGASITSGGDFTWTPPNGPASVSITVRVTDNGSPALSDFETITVTVNNVGPVITSLTVPTAPIGVGNPVTVTWKFDDPGVETYTCEISWDTGTLFQAASYVPPPPSKGCIATSSALPAGVYTVTVRVSDDAASDEEAATTYIVVYDPSAGFVTGGGWINSPPGACQFDACTYDTIGKANFGFVSKYQKGATTPSGNTEFQFHAGDLNFKSNSYEWLVVMGGGRAQYKGRGTINGAGDYGFLLTAIDGSYDKFRIKIWNRTTNAVVYDNQMGQLEDSPAATTIGGGSIVIHAK